MLHQLVASTLPFVPRPIMRRFAGRYIAGETLEEAIAKLRELQAAGYSGILDILGEHVTSAAEARAAAEAYIAVSIKPTHFGLKVDPKLALDLYRRVAERCRALDVFVRVEMEDSTTTDGTLQLFEALRTTHQNVGIVLQARLLRTPGDIDALAPGPIDVRMVKGIYIEPASIAHTSPTAIREAFADCTERLLKRDAHVRLATHDQPMAARLMLLMQQYKRSKEQYEFQVLLGVKEELWQLWHRAGHHVRVYVPFGPDWRAYSQRRLKHNPELLRAVMRNLLRGK
jgi:proline dehydrogenase